MQKSAWKVLARSSSINVIKIHPITLQSIHFLCKHAVHTLHIVHLVLPDMVCIDSSGLCSPWQTYWTHFWCENTHRVDSVTHVTDWLWEQWQEEEIYSLTWAMNHMRGEGELEFFPFPNLLEGFNLWEEISPKIWLGAELITLWIRTVLPQDHQVPSPHI